MTGWNMPDGCWEGDIPGWWEEDDTFEFTCDDCKCECDPSEGCLKCGAFEALCTYDAKSSTEVEAPCPGCGKVIAVSIVEERDDYDDRDY